MDMDYGIRTQFARGTGYCLGYSQSLGLIAFGGLSRAVIGKARLD
jgi:hypothetical protein